MKQRRLPGPYQLFMLGLSLYVLGVLFARTVHEFSASTLTVLWKIDTAICAVFFIDFVRSFVKADSKWKYMLTWGWLDLLSCIPVIDQFRWARIARVGRIIRLLRGMRGMHVLVAELLRRRGETAFYTVALVSLLVIVFGAIAVLQFEKDIADSNIDSASDALWWTVVTMSTVGYGDHYPLSTGGRVVAVLLMMCGIGLFGTFTGVLATWFVEDDSDEVQSEIADMRREISELKDLVETRLPAR
ncbi:MAG: ion transporter [Planctomycetota bacterium]